MGTGGEAPIRYADINGDNSQELIVPTEAGDVHAYEPNGSELPGWPVHTQLLHQAANHLSAPGVGTVNTTAPPREPLRGAAIADLDDDGEPEVIDAAGTHLYVWEPDGSLRPGFPVEVNLANCAPSEQSQPDSHPKCGFVASPAVGRLEGQNQPLDIVVPALDGRLYAWNGDGDSLPNYPVRLQDGDEANPMTAESVNEPAIEDLNGDGKDDVVVATNESYAAAAPALPAAFTGFIGDALTQIVANAAGGSSRVYAVDGASGSFLDGWPIKLDGAIQDTLPFVGPGQNPSIATIGGQKRIVASTTGSITIGIYSTSGAKVGGVDQTSRGPGSDVTIPGGTLNLFESASLGKLLPPATSTSSSTGSASPTRSICCSPGRTSPTTTRSAPTTRPRASRCRPSRGSPTTTSSSPLRTSPRSTRHRSPTRSSPGPGSGSCTPTTAPAGSMRPASPRSPAAGCSRRRRSPTMGGSPTSPARATSSSGTSRISPSARPSGPRSATTSSRAATTTATAPSPARPRASRSAARP